MSCALGTRVSMHPSKNLSCAIMKRLTVLAWVFACSIFVLFTGCSGDDGPASMPGQSTDTNSNNSALSATNAPSSLGPQEVLTLSPSDLTGGPFHITMDQVEFMGRL